MDRDKRGVWVYYQVRPQALASLAALIGCPRRSRTAPHPRARASLAIIHRLSSINDE